MAVPLDPVLHRIVLSRDDFERAAEFAKAARTHDVASIEHEALLHSAILFYARPWLDNEARASKLPEAARKLVGIDVAAAAGTLTGLHDNLIRLRKKVIAHAEAEFFPAQHGGPLTIGNRGTRGMTMVRRTWRVIEENLNLDHVEELADRMKRAAIELQMAKASELGLMQTRTE